MVDCLASGSNSADVLQTGVGAFAVVAELVPRAVWVQHALRMTTSQTRGFTE